MVAALPRRSRLRLSRPRVPSPVDWEVEPEEHMRVVGGYEGAAAGIKHAAIIALCTREDNAQGIAQQLKTTARTTF